MDIEEKMKLLENKKRFIQENENLDKKINAYKESVGIIKELEKYLEKKELEIIKS